MSLRNPTFHAEKSAPCEERVGKRLVHRDSLVWIEEQKLAEEID
jgi:hypothetical protein